MPTVSIVFNLPEAESTKWNAKRQEYDTALTNALNGKEIKVAVTDGDVSKVKAGAIRDALLLKIGHSKVKEILNKGNLTQDGAFTSIQEYDLAVVVKDRAGTATRVRCKADLESTRRKIKILAMKKPAFEDLLKSLGATKTGKDGQNHDIWSRAGRTTSLGGDHQTEFSAGMIRTMLNQIGIDDDELD